MRVYPPYVFEILRYQDETLSWSAISIEAGQTARMCMLAWVYTDGKS